jgi:hypothetical protein
VHYLSKVALVHDRMHISSTYLHCYCWGCWGKCHHQKLEISILGNLFTSLGRECVGDLKSKTRSFSQWFWRLVSNWSFSFQDFCTLKINAVSKYFPCKRVTIYSYLNIIRMWLRRVQNIASRHKFRSFHGSEVSNWGLLGCDAV